VTTRIIASLAALIAAACDPAPVYCDPALAAGVEHTIELQYSPCVLECLDEQLGCLSAEGPGVTEACRACEFSASVCRSECTPPVITGGAL